MGRSKKDSSDDYEPDNRQSESERSISGPEIDLPPEVLTERKAKINRKEIVESEDSDRISSVSGSNSDDYNPDGSKVLKKRSMKRDYDDSDSEVESVKKVVVRQPRKRRKKKYSESTASESATEEESDIEENIAPPVISPIDKMLEEFPHIPRPDIARAYYQNSCQFDKAVLFLKNDWTPTTFSIVTNGNGTHITKKDESQSDSDEPQLAIASDTDTAVRKNLDSSDEEWCPRPRVKRIKKKSRKLSSSEDDMAAENMGNVSDAADEDYSDNEQPIKRSPAVRQKIFQFLRSATEAELMTVEKIAANKAQKLMSLRPFKSLMDFREKVETSRMKGTNIEMLLINVQELLKGREMVETLLRRCQAMSKKLKEKLDDNTKGLSFQKPEGMNNDLVLKPYQKRGVYWFTQIHNMKLGAILADEMGLGKTVQTISFLAWLKINDPGFSRPHIVICPSSTLENWRREFECWLPTFKVHMYYGEHRRHDLRKIIRLKQSKKSAFSKSNDDLENEKKSTGEFEDIDVVLTTYQSAVSGEQDTAAIKKLSVGYAIFDEGHMLKNMNTNRYQNLMKIGARRRILLTGTPLQNNLLELMSLLKFIMPELLQKSTTTLQKIFKLDISESAFARKRVQEAKTILDPFVMRRIKADVLKDLPPKTEETILVDLNEKQLMYYNAIEVEARRKLTEDISEKPKQLKNFYMQLRKAANHPLLHRNHYTRDKLRKMARILCQNELKAEGSVDYIFEDFEVMSDFQVHQTCGKYKSLRKHLLKMVDILNSGKFKKLIELLPPIIERDSRVVLFSQFTSLMDLMEKLLDHHNIGYLRLDGSTPVESRLDLIDEFNADFEIKVFMVSTKAGGLGINLTSADTVILHDIDSNPYNDKQAEDRCHRVGQVKPVKVIRLISKGTIEEKMLAMAHEKLKLEQKVCKEDTIKYSTSQTKAKVEMDAKIEEKSDNEEITPDDLASFLYPVDSAVDVEENTETSGCSANTQSEQPNSNGQIMENKTYPDNENEICEGSKVKAAIGND